MILLDQTDAILEEAYIDELVELENTQRGSTIYFSQISSRPSEDDYLDEDDAA